MYVWLHVRINPDACMKTNYCRGTVETMFVCHLNPSIKGP